MSQTRNSRFKYYTQLFKEAVFGTEQDITQIGLNRAIFLLAVPMVLEMSMESLFAIVDIYFVSKLGKAAGTTVGLTESMMTIIYSLAMALSIAATAIVSRRTGEKNHDAASHAGAQAIYLGFLISVVLGLTGVIFSKQLLLMMGAEPSIAAENYHYTQIIMGSNIVIFLLFLINGVFRGAGDASIAMRSLALANVLNIILCPIFIHYFKLEGAALATTVGRGCGVLYQLYQLKAGKGVIRILKKHLSFDAAIIWDLTKLASGTAGQFIINSASWVFLTSIVASFGTSASAGYVYAMRVIMFTILPAWGLSNAAATLVGQNLGAQRPDRAETSVWKTGWYNTIFLVSIAIIFFIMARPVIGIFSQEADVIEFGVEALRYISLGYLFYGFGMVLVQSFNGAGDTVTPIILNLIGFWAFQMPLAWFLAKPMEFGPKGVFLAISISESAIAVAAMIIFRKGKWKTKQV